MSKIKNTNYLNIQGWMVTELHLKGNELLIYAIIYGFTQDGAQWFEGSRQYLAEWCNSTTRGISKNLNSLVKKGYLIKENVVINNVKFCKYKANINCSLVGNKVHGGKEQSSPPPREQSSPNNLEYKNKNNKSISKKGREEASRVLQEKKEAAKNKYKEGRKTPQESSEASRASKENKNTESNRPSFNDILESYTDNEDLREELREHLRVRKAKGSALTNGALIRALSSLDKLTSNTEDKIIIVREANAAGRVTFYEAFKSFQKKQDKDKSHNVSYDIEAYERYSIFD